MTVGFWGEAWSLTYLIWTREDQAPSKHTDGGLWKVTRLMKHALLSQLFWHYLNYIFYRFYDYSYHALQNLSRPLPGGFSFDYRRVFYSLFFAVLEEQPFQKLPAFSTFLLYLQGNEDKREARKKEQRAQHRACSAATFHVFIFTGCIVMRNLRRQNSKSYYCGWHAVITFLSRADLTNSNLQDFCFLHVCKITRQKTCLGGGICTAAEENVSKWQSPDNSLFTTNCKLFIYLILMKG